MSKAKDIILKNVKTKSGWVFKNTKQFDSTDLKKIRLLRKLRDCDEDQLVFQVNDSNKYVVKFVYFTAPADIESFLNEIRIGFLPSVDTFSVNVHAYTYVNKDGNYGIYVMDHVTSGKPGVKSMSLYDYLNSPNLNYKSFIVKFHKVLQSFYKATEGFHGDLHNQNVLVLLNKNNKLTKVKIIDFGMFTPFKGYNRSMTLSQFLNLSQSTFDNMKSNHQSVYNGVPVKYFPSGRPTRSNKSMLILQNFLKNFKSLNVSLK